AATTAAAATQEVASSARAVPPEMERIERKSNDVTKRPGRLRAALTRVFIPILIARQITSIIAEFDRLRAKVDEFDGELAKRNVSFARSFIDEARRLGGGLSELELQIRAVR